MTTKFSTNRPDVYSRITDKIIADLEQGVRTLMRPWNADHAADLSVCVHMNVFFARSAPESRVTQNA